ncbi:MAG: hypothetical protein R3B74_06010 [Nitrospirales bacterium]|nr:hypothetical protein [Nitrospirales bacterium]
MNASKDNLKILPIIFNFSFNALSIVRTFSCPCNQPNHASEDARDLVWTGLGFRLLALGRMPDRFGDLAANVGQRAAVSRSDSFVPLARDRLLHGRLAGFRISSIFG